MKRFNFLIILLVLIIEFGVQGCSPVIISSSPDTPPPSWFYPNRVETIRYVYFPDYMIYYDLSLRTYIYLDNGVWITVAVLPPRYSSVNLRRSRYIRIRDYYGDNIRAYHRDNRSRNTATRSRSTTTRSRSTTPRDTNTDIRSRSTNTDTRSRGTTSQSKGTRTRSRDTTQIKR